MRFVIAFGMTVGLAIAACSSSDETLGTGESAGGAAGSIQGGAAGEAGAATGGAAGDASGGAAGEAGAAGSPLDAGTDVATEAPFTGTWAVLLVMTSVTEAPVVGKTVNENRTVGRVEQTQVGDKLMIKLKVCDFDIGGDSTMVKVVVPDAFVAGLPEETIEGSVTVDGGGYAMVTPKFWQVRSVELANPTTDALPTDPTDPRVKDWDKDGKPGMTIQAEGSLVSGDMYVIQRTWTELKGAAPGTDAIDGTIAWESEQVLLDATNPVLKMVPSPTATTEPERNYFRFRRIDAVQGCADIVAMQDTLFRP